MSVFSVKSLLLGKFSFGECTVERITLHSAHIDLSLCVAGFCLDTLFCLYQFRDRETYRFMSENEHMKYDTSTHNLKKTICKCAYIDVYVCNYEIVHKEPI